VALDGLALAGCRLPCSRSWTVSEPGSREQKLTPQPGPREMPILCVSPWPGWLKRMTARRESREDGITPAAGGGRRRLWWPGRGPGGDPWVRGGGGGREGVGEEEDESGDDGSDGDGRLPGRMPWPQRTWLAVRWQCEYLRWSASRSTEAREVEDRGRVGAHVGGGGVLRASEWGRDGAGFKLAGGHGLQTCARCLLKCR
jgi:hypothetical protein